MATKIPKPMATKAFSPKDNLIPTSLNTCLRPLSNVTMAIKKPTANMYMGAYFLARSKGLSWIRMSRCTLLKMAKEMVPAITGETTQLATMVLTLPQFTASLETPTAAKPTMAPTMLCVVDTGQPIKLASISQVPAAKSAESIPNTKRSGLSANTPESTMPLRMVEVTSPPAKYAPANSNTMAIKMACLIVRALEPTEVPIALATSFAPTPQAIKKPKAAAMMIKMVPYVVKISMETVPRSYYFASRSSRRLPTRSAVSAMAPILSMVL